MPLAYIVFNLRYIYLPIVLEASSVGGHPNCIWGREFWCQSIVHARACGTVDFCNRTNGWNRSEGESNDINF